jgi:Flp pilus assembly protein CpaB
LLGGWPRRLVALSCLLLAAISAAHATAKPAAAIADVHVVIAAHDLGPGSSIGAGDVRLASWPSALRPSTALAGLKTAVGRRVAGAVGSGELITSSRLIGADLSAGLGAGMVAVPVPLVDSAAVTLIQAGDYVDLLSPPADRTDSAVMVAQAALVLAVTARDPSDSTTGAQLIVAVDRATELRIAQVITSPMLATLIKPP